MAINREVLRKINELAKDDDNMRAFLSELIDTEANEPGRYTEEYVRLLKKYAPQSEGGEHR